MDEMIDILDEQTGNKTGELILKSKAHKEGKWHGSVHILIVNKEHTKTLLQKRQSNKDLFPDMWDIAVGGHISAGESALISAERELYEELGLKPEQLKLKELDRVKEQFTDGGIISCEFVTIFIAYKEVDLSEIKLQKEEVSEVKWCTKSELNKYISDRSIIPHIREYEILNDILK